MKAQYRHWMGLVLLLILALVAAGCAGAGQPAVSQATEPAEDVIEPVRSENSVMAEGRVVPAQDADLSFSVGGVVAEVMVSEGDKVEAGQPLMRLEGNEQLEAALAAAELEQLIAEQALNDLKLNAHLARSQAMLEVALAEKELDKAQDRRESREYRRGDQEQIDIARSNYILAEEAASEAEELYDQVDDRDEDDPVRAEAFSQWAAARQRRDTALANLNYLLSKPDPLDVAEIDARLAVAQSTLADAQRRLAELENGPDPDQLAQAEARVKNAQVAVRAARASLEDMVLTAPFAGTISAINVTTGEFTGPGIVVISMADFETWLVETTDLTELNVARISIGQPAMVNFDALPDLGLIGRVTKIKPFGENRQGDIVYTVVLQLENPDPRLRWNMTAAVTFLENE